MRSIDIGDMVWHNSTSGTFAVVIGSSNGNYKIALPNGDIEYIICSTAVKCTGSSQAKKDIEKIIIKLGNRLGC